MGAHVSVVPNQQTGRVTPLSTRGYVAMSGNFGYELDLNVLTDEEIDQIKEQICLYKEIRETIQNGVFYRIKNPFEENIAQWNFVSKDGKSIVAFQGGIIVALLIGIVTAKLDIFFEKKVPEIIRLLVSPLLTTLVSAFLLFLYIISCI